MMEKLPLAHPGVYTTLPNFLEIQLFASQCFNPGRRMGPMRKKLQTVLAKMEKGKWS
jgi:hypothetical protein